MNMLTIELGYGTTCISAVNYAGNTGILFRPTDKPETIGLTVETSADVGIFIRCSSLESLAVLERKIDELKKIIREGNQ